MFIFLNGRNVDVYTLQVIDIVEDADNGVWNIISLRLSEDNNVLESFSEKAQAEAYLKQIQDGLATLENTVVLDFRTEQD